VSSNDYSACVSRNLVRTSLFGYDEQASSCAPSEGADSRGRELLPWASFRPFPNFNSDRDGRRLTGRQDTPLLSL